MRKKSTKYGSPIKVGQLMNCLGTSVRIKAEPEWVSMSWDRDSGQRYLRDGASWPKLRAKYIKSVRLHMYLTACSVGSICF